MNSMIEKLKIQGINKVLAYLDSDYERNVPKLVTWLERFDKQGRFKNTYANIHRIMDDPSNNWNVLLKNVYQDIDPASRRTLLNNFVINASLTGSARREAIMKKEDCNIPWAILMDPTSGCNLKCIGCWAAEYGAGMSMDLDTLDRIIQEGKELGIYMYIYSGGEPLVRKEDIITLCEKHNDCAFLAFTNGTLIDEAFALDMKRVHNFVPAISVEGFEEDTDARRGKGTYERLTRGMDILRKYQLPFGISTCYTSQNIDTAGSDEFMDAMIEKGAYFCWYFTYLPIGKNAPTDLMASADQRAFMYRQVRRWRNEKPIFIMDFWNDGEYVNGCIAGGRSYLHINANGDVEPCAFIHYANMNIRHHSLLETLKSPLFREYRDHQPFNQNQLRPCPLLDNPMELREMVHRSKAVSTDLLDREDVDHLTEKCLDHAKAWADTSQKIWEDSPAGKRAQEKRSPC